MRVLFWATLCGVLGAVLLGLVGFVAGFYGPLLLTPDSNQGPLLGIFITGPGGLLVGLIGGVIVGALYGRSKVGSAG